MGYRTTFAFLASTLVLATPSPSEAQWNGGPTPRQGACFYQDINYRGSYFCLGAGEELDSMPSGANDKVSSIRVFGGVSIAVFKDPRFRGEALRFDSDVRDLQREDFNDEISSVAIERRSAGRGNGRGGGSQGNPEVIVRRAYQDILERDPDQAGMRLYRSRIIDDDWTEQDVREALRKSPEYREKNTMTRAKAEDIVRRAYLAVLKREPDATGSANYVISVMRDKWTQQDVERELRRSPEFRNNPNR
jgi:hypothetical protein